MTDPSKDDLEYEAIASLLGQAIAAWTRVEEELCLVFQAALNAPHPYVARAVYYEVHSFETRLDMTDAAVRAVMPFLKADLSGEWKSLYEKLGKAKRKRNQIAHADIIGHSVHPAPMAYYVDPYGEETAKRSMPRLIDPRRLLSQTHVTHRRNSFLLTACRVAKFETQLCAEQGRPSASFLLATHHARVLRASDARTRGEGEPPPEPSQE